MRRATCIVALFSIATGGCVYEDVCKNGARRMDGVCTLGPSLDAGADGASLDGRTPDGGAPDAGEDEDGGPDAGAADAGMPDPVEEISVGAAHVCVRRASGQVFCWGNNMFGQIGQPDMAGHVASEVALAAPALSVAGTALSTCARLDDNNVACWGNNGADQTIQDGAATIVAPPALGYDMPTIAIAVGFANACVSTIGGVYCRGRNEYGQAGFGGTVSPVGFDNAAMLASGGMLDGIVQIAVGDKHICFRDNDGLVHCAGRNTEGALGDGTTTDSAYAARTSLIEQARDVAATDDQTCAVGVSGTVSCWGMNDRGEIHGAAAPVGAAVTSPVSIDGVSNARSVAMGKYHACALRGDGNVLCWGWQEGGAIGNGVTSADSTAEPYMLELPEVVQISAGIESLTCALTAAGAVYCWGSIPPLGVADIFGDGAMTHASPVAIDLESLFSSAGS